MKTDRLIANPVNILQRCGGSKHSMIYVLLNVHGTVSYKKSETIPEDRGEVPDHYF
jgi:hypothetical protein